MGLLLNLGPKSIEDAARDKHWLLRGPSSKRKRKQLEKQHLTQQRWFKKPKAGAGTI